MSLMDMLVGRRTTWDKVDATNPQAVKMALDAGADPNEIVPRYAVAMGRFLILPSVTALGKAVAGNSAESASLLFSRGAKVDDSFSWALEHLLRGEKMPGGVQAGRQDRIVELLLNSEADLDKPVGRPGRTLRTLLVNAYPVDKLSEMGMVWKDPQLSASDEALRQMKASRRGPG